MGTRYEDQPPELWAGPESLDPTPVWKQFLLIGLLLLGAIALVVGVSAVAVAPLLVAPPALVPGDRLVLPGSYVRAIGAPPYDVVPPLVDEAHRLWLGRVSATEVVAIRAIWAPRPGEPECPVGVGVFGGAIGYVASCERTAGRVFTFDAQGGSRDGASRGLDRYLVSVGDDRVIVNLGRLIVSEVRVPASPTP
ncbi:MAG: hypothetical protein E6H88_00330 [Chloroflexi bacterium]|nr:MAG: hypothetical protein E6H88_00330 [Chloroflexota bacterium]